MLAENLVTLARPKHLALQEPQIELSFTKQYGIVTAVTLEAKKPALWVWLEAEEEAVRFSNNFFHLRPGRPVTVTVSGAGPGTAVSITAHSLIDTDTND